MLLYRVFDDLDKCVVHIKHVGRLNIRQVMNDTRRVQTADAFKVDT